MYVCFPLCLLQLFLVIMLFFTFLRFQIVIFVTIHFATVDTRSIPDSDAKQMITNPFTDNDQKLFVTLANYRHRFERSMNFKKLRWTLSSLNSSALCDACNLLVPEVRFILEITSLLLRLARCEF